MRGHGRSGKPEAKESYLSERYAEDYLAVAREFSLKKPLFVGWCVDISFHGSSISESSALPYQEHGRYAMSVLVSRNA